MSGGGAPVRTAAVLGLGLIGGSLARDLTALGVRVLGRDADRSRERAARHAGAIDAIAGPALEELAEAELVVLAVPVSEAPAVLRTALPHLARARLVTDVGSTKRGIVRAAVDLGLGARFVGAHPLAGDHRAGWEASRAGLFRGARVYLTPTAASAPDVVAVARSLWIALGAAPELLDAEAHDTRLAWTSHLPQAAASALALALRDAGLSRDDLGPGGRDTTRLAASDPAMWTAIALENGDVLGPAISALQRRLDDLRIAAERGDAEALRRIFERGRAWAADDSDEA